DPARVRLSRRGDSRRASGRDPRSRLRRSGRHAMSRPDSTPLEHKATAPRTIGCWVLPASDTKTPDTDTSGELIRKPLREPGHEVVGSTIVRDEPRDVQR